MDFATKYKVNVITILHKLTTISSFLFISPLIVGFFGFLITQSREFAIVCAIFGFFTPLIIAFGFYSTTDYMTLQKDGILFEKRGFVPFGDIIWYRTDYLIKLKLKNHYFKWEIGSKVGQGDVLLNFIRDFEEAIHLWIAENQDLIKNSDIPKQKYFFGSTSAKFIGVIFFILGICATYLFYISHSPQMIPLMICCFLFGYILFYPK